MLGSIKRGSPYQWRCTRTRPRPGQMKKRVIGLLRCVAGAMVSSRCSSVIWPRRRNAVDAGSRIRGSLERTKRWIQLRERAMKHKRHKYITCRLPSKIVDLKHCIYLVSIFSQFYGLPCISTTCRSNSIQTQRHSRLHRSAFLSASPCSCT